jgi:hypothetical protein
MGDHKVINFAICWNSLVSIGTFNSENLIGYAQSAGNLSILSNAIFVVKQKKVEIYIDKSSSETTRETSFNFEAFRKLSNKSHVEISDKWLS